ASSTSMSATSYPSAASRFAAPSPSPLEPPVTAATRIDIDRLQVIRAAYLVGAGRLHCGPSRAQGPCTLSNDYRSTCLHDHPRPLARRIVATELIDDPKRARSMTMLGKLRPATGSRCTTCSRRSMTAAPQNSMWPLTRDRPSRVTVVER